MNLHYCSNMNMNMNMNILDIKTRNKVVNLISQAKSCSQYSIIVDSLHSEVQQELVDKGYQVDQHDNGYDISWKNRDVRNMHVIYR